MLKKCPMTWKIKTKSNTSGQEQHLERGANFLRHTARVKRNGFSQHRASAGYGVRVWTAETDADSRQEGFRLRNDFHLSFFQIHARNDMCLTSNFFRLMYQVGFFSSSVLESFPTHILVIFFWKSLQKRLTRKKK